MKSSLIQHVYAVYADDADKRIQVSAESEAEAIATGARLLKCKKSDVIARYVKTIAIPQVNGWNTPAAKDRLARQGSEQWERRQAQARAQRVEQVRLRRAAIQAAAATAMASAGTAGAVKTGGCGVVQSSRNPWR